MPLSQSPSKNAFTHNLKAEMHAGKPMKQSLAIAYNVKKRNHKAGGGAIHCAHGGPAYCNEGCYMADGGLAEERDPMMDHEQSEDAEKSIEQAKAYEMKMDEPMEDEENVKMAKGGMMSMHPHHMAKMIMAKKMAKGGMVNSESVLKEADDMELSHEHQPSSGMAKDEDIDMAEATPHDDHLSSESDYPLMEEEGYEEGHQSKMRRKDILSRIMMGMK